MGCLQARFPTPKVVSDQDSERLQQKMGTKLDTRMVMTMMATGIAVECLANYYLAMRLDAASFGKAERLPTREEVEDRDRQVDPWIPATYSSRRSPTVQW